VVFLKGIRKKTGSFILGRKVRGLSRNRQFINLADIHTVGIIFHQSDNKVFESVNDFIKSLTAGGKQISAIGYIDADEIPDPYLLRKGYHFFCMKELNWYFRPESPFIDDFQEREFDLVINLSLDTLFPIDYIYAMSKARLKAGKYFDNSEYSDLSIDIKNSRDVRYLTEQITHYLNIINKKEL